MAQTKKQPISTDLEDVLVGWQGRLADAFGEVTTLSRITPLFSLYSQFGLFVRIELFADWLQDLIWSGQRGSNPHSQLGRLELYH